MPVQITINGENAEQAIQELAVLSTGIIGKPAAFVTAPETPKADKPTFKVPERIRTKPEPAKAPPTTPPDPKDEPADDALEADTDVDAADEPIPTDVELRELARQIGSKGPEGKAAIKALLSKYGVPNITAVPDNKRIAFKRDLEALAL